MIYDGEKEYALKVIQAIRDRQNGTKRNPFSEDLASGVDSLRTIITKSLENHKHNTQLHNDVFVKLDVASDLFEVLVLKTESTIPYSSVFMELDCAYWDAEKEQKLRSKMEE